MKKNIFVALVVLVLAALFVAPVFAQGTTPPDVGPLVLPDALQAFITIGVAFFVTQGLKSIFVKNGLDLSGVAAQVTGGIVTAIIGFGNFLLSLVPTAYVEPTSIVLTLVISLLGVFGVHYSYAALKRNK